jgi:L-fuconolactonase
MQDTPPNQFAHPVVRQDWLDLHAEPILEPDLPIVDAHHHLWSRPHGRYELPELRQDLSSGHNVIGTVYIECGSRYRTDGPEALRPVGETEFAAGVAAEHAQAGREGCRVCAGIIGYADLLQGESVGQVLDAHIAAGKGHFKGVRNISAWHADPAARGSLATPPPGLLLDRSFQDGYACLEQRGLVFDAWLYHTQLQDLFQLASAFPGTTIVLNHIGGPIGIGPYENRRQGVFAEWQAKMRKLATLPNMHIKLGGFGMRLFGFNFHERAAPPNSSQLAQSWRPYVEAVIEAFGADRCMFESNFPVDKAMHSYATTWNAFKRLSANYSMAEKTALFSGTAARVYKLK